MKSVVFHIVKKEFIQFRKDRKMLVMSLILPILQLLLLGYAANIDIKNIPVVICDYDKSALSRGYFNDLTNSGYFSITKYVDKMNEIDSFIDNGKASIGLVIPKDFNNNIISGKNTEVLAIIDGSDSNSATIGMNYISIITSRYSQKFSSNKLLKMKSLGINSQVIDSKIRVWYNPELKSKNFMIPGVLGLLLMIQTLILTSLAIVKEKEIGTLEQLSVTPIKPYELILGKLIPFTIIGIIDLILVSMVAVLWFAIPLKGSVILLFIFSVFFLTTTLGLGLFISTLVSNQQQAMMASIFFVQTPMMFLSGFIFPVENMPRIMQVFTHFMPLKYYLSIVRGIFLKGAGFRELWSDGAALLILGIAIIIVSVLRFHKRAN